jgi:uncharacterized membrane protein
MSAYLAAALVAVLWGLAMVFWELSMQKINALQLILIIGVVYSITAIIWVLVSGEQINFALNSGWAWGTLTALIYVLAMVGISYAITRPGANLSAITAISASYPVITALFVAIQKWRAPSLPEAFFILLIIGGVIGLTIVKNEAASE